MRMDYEREQDETNGRGRWTMRKVSRVTAIGAFLLLSVRSLLKAATLMSWDHRDRTTQQLSPLERRQVQEEERRSAGLQWEQLKENSVTRLPAPPPPYAVSEQMRRRNCSIAAQARMKRRHDQWWSALLPLLTGVLLSPPSREASEEEDCYHVFFNIRSMRKERKDFLLKETEWICEWSAHEGDVNKAALSAPGNLVGVEPGDPDGVTAILQCPQFSKRDKARQAPLRRITLRHFRYVRNHEKTRAKGDDNQTALQAKVAPPMLVKLVSYDVGLAARCAQEERAIEYVPHPPPTIAACPIIWGPAILPQFRQWIAYHRIIGVQHFFVYIHQPWSAQHMAHHLPSAPYITYRPFDVDGVPKKIHGGATEKNFYQPNQQTDCIYRARTFGSAGGIHWLAITDIDEYIQVMQPATKKDASFSEVERVLQPLHFLAEKGHFAGVLLRNWFWGANRLEVPDPTTNFTAPLQNHDYDFQHVHRAPWHSRRWRTKNIVYPWNVRYYTMHQITEGLAVDRQQNASTTPQWLTQNSGEIPIHHQHYLLDPQQQMRLSHFKEPAKGVYDFRGKPQTVASTVQDDHLLKTYLHKMQQFIQTMEYYD